MLQKWVNLLRGTIVVAVEAPFPERVLNLCGGWKIPFWDLVWKSPTAFTFCLYRQDYDRLLWVCEQVEAEFRICGRAGVPYWWHRLQKRWGLLVGLGLSSFLLVLTSFFVWDFQVEGNENIPTETILRALAEEGVKQGCFAYGIDSEALRNEILPKLPELNWLVINVKGCRATVQVRERVPVPDIWSKKEPANLVAAKSGLVTRVQALDGLPTVLAGETVLAGDLLISGVRSGEVYGTSFMSGLGEVRARTWYELTAKVPMSVQKKTIEKTKVRYALLCGEKRINFFQRSGIGWGTYDTIQTRTQWTLPGKLILPISTIREERTLYTLTETLRTEEEAKEIGKALLLTYLESLLTEGEIQNTRFATTRQGDCLLLSLSAECEESIGRLQLLPQGENEGE